MSTVARLPPRISGPPIVSTPLPSEAGRRDAIAYESNSEPLRLRCGDRYNNALPQIRRVLLAQKFLWQQGSVEFGGDQFNAVTCVLAAIDLSRELPWFASSVRDVQMLRIEERNDLMPAVKHAASESERRLVRAAV
jgi:virulence-associated protein VapD